MIDFLLTQGADTKQLTGGDYAWSCLSLAFITRTNRS